MDNYICKADIKPRGLNHKKILINQGIIFIVCIIACCITNWLLGGLILIGMIVRSIMLMAEKAVANQCRLYLTNKEIKGTRKYSFSSKDLIFPIEKIDNVMVVNSLLDKIRGGKTVAIRTASGLIKFPWVQNADEFVAKTLEVIQEFKEVMQKNVTELNSAAPAVSKDSEIDKIKKLKSLLDHGLITQEEFESKRKELLEKI